jgi:CubicO group peptidase (beta-lactamase class C family)
MMNRFFFVLRQSMLIAWLFFALTATAQTRAAHAAGAAARPKTELTGPDYSRMRQRLQRLISKEMKRNEITGLSIAVIDEQEVIWSQGFGYAVSSEQLEVDGDTVFLTASVTKLFTAAAVMKLVEGGAIDLDASITEYLGELSMPILGPGSPMPTVRQLLTHHSGLPADLLKGASFGVTPPADFATRFMEVPAMLAEEVRPAPPGQFYSYSNIGFDLLGAAVARVSGLDFVDYVESQLFVPLGMSRSTFTELERLKPNLSAGYGASREMEILHLRGIAEGGLFSSTADLARFARMVLAGGELEGRRILRCETLQEMMRPQAGGLARDFGADIGLGFHLMDLPGCKQARCVFHDGGTWPFASTIMLLPEYGLGVVVLLNSNEASPYKIARSALSLALEAKTGEKSGRATAAGSTVAPTIEAGGADSVGLSPQQIPGIYASEIGLVRISRGFGGSQVHMGGSKLHLVHRGGDRYGLQLRLFGLLPLPLQDLKAIELRFRRIDGERTFGLFEGGKFRGIGTEVKVVPISSLWRGRIGEYRIENQDPVPFAERIALSYDNELELLLLTVKVATIPEALSFALDPISPTSAVVQGKGRHLGEVIQVRHIDGTERLLYSGLDLVREIRRLP